MMVGAVMPPETVDLIDRWALAQRSTRSRMIRTLVEEALKTRGAPPARPAHPWDTR